MFLCGFLYSNVVKLVFRASPTEPGEGPGSWSLSLGLFFSDAPLPTVGSVRHGQHGGHLKLFCSVSFAAVQPPARGPTIPTRSRALARCGGGGKGGKLTAIHTHLYINDCNYR